MTKCNIIDLLLSRSGIMKHEGRNLVERKTDIELHDVTFNDVSNEWMSSPVHFSGAATSYGQFINVDDVKVSGSFTLIMAVYQEEESYGPLLEWHTGLTWETHIWMKFDQFFIQIRCTFCSKQDMTNSSSLISNQWYTLALSFDYDRGMLSMWVDGELEQTETDPCTSGYKGVASAFVNNRCVLTLFLVRQTRGQYSWTLVVQYHLDLVIIELNLKVEFAELTEYIKFS